MTTSNVTYEPVRTVPRRRKGINVRLIVFITIVASPFLWFGYVFLNQVLTHGIQRHGDYSSVDLKSLGNFYFDGQNGTLNDIPARWRQLDGKKVELEGFMWAGSSAAPEVNDFQFVYSITKCCFNGPPLVQERVFARVPPEQGAVPLYSDLVKLTGVLHVNVIKEGDKVQAVYLLDVQKVEPT